MIGPNALYDLYGSRRGREPGPDEQDWLGAEQDQQKSLRAEQDQQDYLRAEQGDLHTAAIKESGSATARACTKALEGYPWPA
jgi:hypothetical protein